jgi:hypothetical protein
MKKIYFTILPLLFSCIVYAQCIPDPNWNSFGLNPSKLPDGYAGSGYATIITFVTPKDSSLNYNGTPVKASIDSATVEKVAGYPAGFIWKCNTSNCSWKGGEKGCALLEGNADSSHMNKYEIKIYIRTYFKIEGLSNLFERIDSSIIDFKIVGGKSSVNTLDTKPSFSVFPNPAKNNIQVEANYLGSGQTNVFIYDLLGKLHYTNTIKGNSGSLDVSEIKKGVYVISFNNDGNTFTQKLIIE